MLKLTVPLVQGAFGSWVWVQVRFDQKSQYIPTGEFKLYSCAYSVSGIIHYFDLHKNWVPHVFKVICDILVILTIDRMSPRRMYMPGILLDHMSSSHWTCCGTLLQEVPLPPVFPARLHPMLSTSLLLAMIRFQAMLCNQMLPAVVEVTLRLQFPEGVQKWGTGGTSTGKASYLLLEAFSKDSPRVPRQSNLNFRGIGLSIYMPIPCYIYVFNQHAPMAMDINSTVHGSSSTALA